MSKGQGKLLTKKLIKVHKQNTNQGMFFKELTLVGEQRPVSQNYLFIAYIFIKLLCAKMSRVKKAYIYLAFYLVIIRNPKF